MNRRQFIACSGAAGILAAQGIEPAVSSAEPESAPERMKLGDQT